MSLREVTGQRKDKPALVNKEVIKFDGDEAVSGLQQWKDSGSNWSKNHWHLNRSSVVRKHNLKNYECAVSRKKGCTCPAKLRIRWPSDSQEIVVEETGQQLGHESTRPGILSLLQAVSAPKTKEGKRAKIIQQEMTTMISIHSVPKLLQIQNFMSFQKRGDTALEGYAVSKIELTKDENRVYVPSFKQLSPCGHWRRQQCAFSMSCRTCERSEGTRPVKKTKRNIYLNVKKIQLAISEMEIKQAALAIMEYWSLNYAAQEEIRHFF